MVGWMIVGLGVEGFFVLFYKGVMVDVVEWRWIIVVVDIFVGILGWYKICLNIVVLLCLL